MWFRRRQTGAEVFTCRRLQTSAADVVQIRKQYTSLRLCVLSMI